MQLIDIRTLVQRGLRTGTPTAEWKTFLNDCINTEMWRMAYEDERVGLNRTSIVGSTFGTLSTTCDNTAANATLIEFTGETFLTSNVVEGDILEIGNLRWLITSVTATQLGVGAPLQTGISPTAATVYRRGIKMPDPGHVRYVRELTTGNEVAYGPKMYTKATAWNPLTSGSSASFADSAYDQSHDSVIMRFYPAPTSPKRYVISSTKVPDILDEDTDDLDWPNPIIYSLVSAAVETAMRRVRESRGIPLAAAAKDRLEAYRSYDQLGGQGMYQ